MTEAPPTTLLLPRATPSEVGIPAASINTLLDAFDAEDLELHSLMIVRHGRIAAEGWWAPYSADRVHLLYSLSKSFTSTAVGLCIAEGRFRLEDRVVNLLPDRVPKDVDPSVASLTVHHLLSMSTGHSQDTLDRAVRADRDDLVRAFLRIPPDQPVGSRHAYNNATTYALAALVERYTGMPLLDYLRPRLLDPLGIGPARWDTDERGQALGFTGLHLQTEAVAAFGQLLLQDGLWHGEQVLPQRWVALATRKHIDSGLAPDGNGYDPNVEVEWRQGYGYQYWIARHGFRGDGAFGQFCVVLPDRDLVVAATACTTRMQSVLDLLWDRLLPAIDTAVGADEDAAAARLRDRLAFLALPIVEAIAGAPAGAVRFTVEDTSTEAPFVKGTPVTVTSVGNDHRLVFELATGQLDLRCGRSRWVEQLLAGATGSARDVGGGLVSHPQPVVVRGGWTSADTFEADLVLIETPHRIRMRCNGSRLTAEWNAPPLMGTRIEAHLPG
jgi:CubicO group peptidase (beta-lactamase class C family)